MAFDMTLVTEPSMRDDRSRAFSSGYADIAIAATAQVPDRDVLTANGRHFEPLGVPWMDPLQAMPPD